MSNINLKLIAEMREQLGSQRSDKNRLPAGDYVGRVVNSQNITDRWGRPATRTIFEITDGAHAGHRIRADLRGHAERLVKGAASHKRFRVFIYDNRSHDGSVFSNVDVETIQLIPDGVAAGPALAPAVAPSVEEVLRASHGFDVGFICLDTVTTTRQQVRWHETFNRMARPSVPMIGETPAFPLLE